MHQAKLKAAKSKFQPLLTDGKTEAEVKEAIAADKKGYSEDEQAEIWQSLDKDGTTKVQGTAPGNKTLTATLNKTFEEWKVEPVYEDVKDGMGKVIGRKLTDYTKSGKLIRTTSITPERADALNEQSENTGVRLFEVQ